MDEKSIKIRLKINSLEVEYEGDASFVQDDLPSFVDRMIAVHETHQAVLPTASSSEDTPNPSPVATNGIDLSTDTIAMHLEGDSAPELAMAAAAHLTLVESKDKFTRNEILEEMKGATSHYKKNMSGNLSQTLESLCKKGRLIQRATGEYAIPVKERKSLEDKLAQFS